VERIRLIMLVCAIASVETQAGAQTLDDAAVGSALQAGVTKKFSDLISDCVATPGFGEGMGASLAGGIQPIGAYTVTASGAEGRIAFLAADAKRLYKPFGLSDVPPQLRDRSMLFVTVTPHAPKKSSSSYDVPSPIERVVLKSKADPNKVVQPENIELSPLEWGNLMGGKVQGNSAVATFPHSVTKELPPGDIDIVVITEAGERRCKIGTKDRAKIIR